MSKATLSAVLTVSQVRDATRAKLATSGLDDHDLKLLKLEPRTAAEAAKLKGLGHPLAGFKLPYFDLRGRPTKFWRYRFLESTLNGFAKLTVKKPQRYAQPAGSVNEVYLPPLLDWEDLAANSKQPLLITEGELKAACACKLGFPTLGLGGVWCFRSAAQNLPLLPQLRDDFAWSGRPVYVVYDADVVSNPQVAAAENVLCRELLKLGADPRVARLPALPDVPKTGLDDFLVARGPEALHPVLEAASVFRAAEALHALNEQVIYVQDPGLVVWLYDAQGQPRLQRLTPRAFVEHAFAPYEYTEQVETQAGTKLVVKSAPKEWLKWTGRASSQRATYAPGEGRLTQRGELNLWPGWGVEPAAGSVVPWAQLLDRLFQGADPAHRHWFEQWLAYPLQHPGEKLYSAAVLWGLVHGTGKSLVGYTMFEIYGANATEIGNRDLASPHNEWSENKQFVMGDEITSGDHGGKRHEADRMKSMITQKQLRLNPKYIPSYTVPDRLNYYFTSNHPDAFFVEDTDRRFFIHEVLGDPLPDTFYRTYLRWLREEGGAAALFHYLLHLDLTGFNAQGHAPVTTSKLEMIEGGRSELATWIAALKLDPTSVLQVGGRPLPRKFWTSSELLALYDAERRTKTTANTIGRELKRAGFARVNDGAPVKTALGLQRLWFLGPAKDLKTISGADAGRYYDKERR